MTKRISARTSDVHNKLIDEAVAGLIKDKNDIQPVQNPSWVPALEQHLTRSFPPSFRSLITRYRFGVLDFDVAELFSNQDDASDYDLTTAPFRDPNMSPWLIQNGFIHIGHPCIGNYDPVCFDMNGLTPDQEPEIVVLNHEDILLARQKVRITPLTASFIELLGSSRG